jgi:hypothetical protein
MAGTRTAGANGTTPVDSIHAGVRATLRLATDPGLDGVTGRYFDGLDPAEPNPQARDAGARSRLRALSDHLCGLVPATGDRPGEWFSPPSRRSTSTS